MEKIVFSNFRYETKRNLVVSDGWFKYCTTYTKNHAADLAQNKVGVQ